VLRRASDSLPDHLRFALTVAAPSAKIADRWGDWHLAHALAESLRYMGHEVRPQAADQADSLAGRACDVHVVLRGLHPVRASEGQRHVLWIISHPEAIENGELDEADLVLVASHRFAEHLRTRTDTPVEVMLQATDHRRFTPRRVDPAHRHDVTVVAKTRDVLRPIVADALAAGLRPAIYGGGWRELVDPSLVVADHVANEVLPSVYSSAGVVLNDHWGTMKAWGFMSNRLLDVLACGTPVVSDAVDGLAELFAGAVLEYHTPTELRALVDEVLADPDGARERAVRGRELVLANHTMDLRARQLVDSLVSLA
jgi:glycosyltransferase involved in cell wall biosynthesis